VGYPEARISIIGFIVILQDGSACWRSKAQKGDSLSSSETKYVATSDAVKEINFNIFFFKILVLNLAY
jgi:hypothetical protein